MQSHSLEYMPRPDVLRFAAAASVVLYHFYGASAAHSEKYALIFLNLVFHSGSCRSFAFSCNVWLSDGLYFLKIPKRDILRVHVE